MIPSQSRRRRENASRAKSKGAVEQRVNITQLSRDRAECGSKPIRLVSPVHV